MKKIFAIASFVLGVFLTGLGAKYFFVNSSMPDVVEVKDFNVHSKNEGKIVMMVGRPTYNGTVEDPAFGVKVNAPMLMRKVEMFQYLKGGPADKPFMDKGWSEKLQPTFEARTMKEYNTKNAADGFIMRKIGGKFTNPNFPAGIKSENFGAELTFNNGNLKLAKSFATKFGQSNFIYFENKDYVKSLASVGNLPDGRQPKNFVNQGNMYYLTDNGSTASAILDSGVRRDVIHDMDALEKIGDVRVTYKAFLAKNFPECTIIGKQVNGVIQDNDDARFIDRVMTKDELKKLYKSGGRSAAIGAIICALLFFGLGVFLYRKK